MFNIERKGEIMSRKFIDLIRFVGNYGYYRKKGFAPSKARRLARMTLPT
jgi:hypothetical protein